MIIEKMKLSDLKPAKYNPRKSDKEQEKNLTASLKKFGVVEPIVYNKRTDTIVGGHFRVRELTKLGHKEVECVIVDLNVEDEKELNIRLNANTGTWDWDILNDSDVWDKDLLEEYGLDVFGFDDDQDDKEFDNTEATSKLSERFVIPPVSIMDTRQGYWKERKEKWNELINDGGESRKDTLYGDSDVSEVTSMMHEIGSVSVLDPVIAEVANKWFAQKGANTFDPFAGDTVFGYVSSKMGHEFTGIELRQEQCDLNNKRIAEIGTDSKYICDDAQNIDKHIKPNSQDMMFSCPPYYNIEVYSDLENDASNQGTYEDFIKIIDNAFTKAIECLKDNRFAFIVAGDIRSKKTGFYYGFIDDLKAIFKRGGMSFYNDIVLINNYGAAIRRVGRQMKSRKVSKVHQNVLVFYKGNQDYIKENFDEIETENESSITASVEDLDELLNYRKPFIKEKLIMYYGIGVIREALEKEQIHISYNNGEIVGYLWFKNYTRNKYGKVEEICSTKRGVGTMLIEFAEELTTYDKIRLEVVDYNDNAIEFYKNRGYETVSTKKGKITNLVMEKQL